MAKYVKKPVVVEAVQYTGNNLEEVLQFISAGTRKTDKTENGVVIHTLEGDMLASVGDYIIRGVHGEHYPCKPDIFDKTYERADIEPDPHKGLVGARIEAGLWD